MKTIRFFSTVVIWTIINITAAHAQNTNLQKPISRIPTVGTEIKRGSYGTYNCLAKMKNELSALEYALCVDSFVDSDLANGPPTDAFLFGAYLTSIRFIKIALKPDASETRPAWETRSAKIIYSKWIKKVREAIARAGYTEIDFCNSVGSENLKSCTTEPLP